MTEAAEISALGVKYWDMLSLGYGYTDLTAVADRNNTDTDWRTANMYADLLIPEDEADYPRTETPIKF